MLESECVYMLMCMCVYIYSIFVYYVCVFIFKHAVLVHKYLCMCV